MAFKETVVFFSLIALAVLSFNVIDTEASFKSQSFSNQWNHTLDGLIDIGSAIIDVGLSSQNLKDAIGNYQSDRADYYPVSHAQNTLLKAKTKLCLSLNEYFGETRKFESNGQENYADNHFDLYHYQNVYQTRL